MSYGQGSRCPLPGSPTPEATSSLHTYTILWTPQNITFLIDAVPVRTVVADTTTANYPSTPMRLRVGSWVGGKRENPDGTIGWAGGLADFDNAPFVAVYKEISVADYAGGDGGGGASPAAAAAAAAAYLVRVGAEGDGKGRLEVVAVPEGGDDENGAATTATSIVSRAAQQAVQSLTSGGGGYPTQTVVPQPTQTDVPQPTQDPPVPETNEATANWAAVWLLVAMLCVVVWIGMVV